MRSRNGSGFSSAFCALLQLRQHGGLGGFQHAIEPPQHGERQDDLAVFGLLVVAAQQIGDGPDEGREIGVAHIEGYEKSLVKYGIGIINERATKSSTSQAIGANSNFNRHELYGLHRRPSVAELLQALEPIFEIHTEFQNNLPRSPSLSIRPDCLMVNSMDRGRNGCDPNSVMKGAHDHALIFGGNAERLFGFEK